MKATYCGRAQREKQLGSLMTSWSSYTQPVLQVLPSSRIIVTKANELNFFKAIICQVLYNSLMNVSLNDPAMHNIIYYITHTQYVIFIHLN